MEIALGIGDILITRMRENPKTIIFNRQIIRSYRNDSQEYYHFCLWLISKLFPESQIIEVSKNFNIFTSKTPIKNLSLSHFFDFKEVFDFPYLVFHTKARFDSDKGSYYQTYKPFLSQFFKNFQSRFPIVLMGDKEIDPNAENQIHNVDSLYSELKEMEKTNRVIDKCRPSLQQNPNSEEFCNDISIIHGAICNIGFGYGGNFVISTAFSQKFSFFIGKITHEYFDQIRNLKDENYQLFSDLEKFCDFLQTEFSLT